MSHLLTLQLEKIDTEIETLRQAMERFRTFM